MTSLSDLIEVVIGVDTHVDSHTSAVVDARTGGVLAESTVSADPDGYDELIDWADTHSMLRVWAIEGTGGHGAGLARLLAERGETVVELDRPERPARRGGAKSDPLDAARAAREALSRPQLGTPRSGGDRQALSVLLAARRSAVESAADAQRQVFSLVIAAPEALRGKFRGKKVPAMITVALRLRVDPAWDTETATTARVLRSLARRATTLAREAAEHEKAIVAIVRAWRPDLLAQTGVGPIVAATVLCAWSHAGRIHSEAAFAKLAGVAPIPANSGKVTTHWRLSRYGDRRLNQALHTIALCRLRWDPTTKAYAARRTSEGKTPREIKRCLKRYIARDLYRLLENPQPAT
jgi:transposase